jgi:biotin carboxyl carrier protein
MRELIVNDEKLTYEIDKTSMGGVIIKFNGKSYEFNSWSKSNINELKRVAVDGKNINIWKTSEWTSFADTLVKVRSTRSEGRNKSGSGDQGGMVSPMPGKILKVMVSVGDEVSAGQGLLVMEAMKMEHTIKADTDGVVERIECEEGGLVDGGVELVSLSKKEEE